MDPSVMPSVHVRDALLDRLERSPYVDVHRCGDRAVIQDRARGLVLGRLDLRTGVLTVEAAAQRSGRGRCGRLVLSGVAALKAAEALLRRRLDLELFGWQSSDAL